MTKLYDLRDATEIFVKVRDYLRHVQALVDGVSRIMERPDTDVSVPDTPGTCAVEVLRGDGAVLETDADRVSEVIARHVELNVVSKILTREVIPTTARRDRHLQKASPESADDETNDSHRVPPFDYAVCRQRCFIGTFAAAP